MGDSKHSTGVVMAEIVKANIPVKNGVVHLIHRPLMIVDTTVIQFLEVRELSHRFNIFFYNTLKYLMQTNPIFPIPIILIVHLMSHRRDITKRRQ